MVHGVQTLVHRKDGRLRLCVDYRALHAKTYPLPNIEATLAALGGLSWFCTFDLRSGYYNVIITEENRDNTHAVCYATWNISLKENAIRVVGLHFIKQLFYN